jgi:hypothetical protein
MSNWKDWSEHQANTEVCEKDGKYYLKGNPKLLYDSYEEAKKSSDFWRNLIVL